MKYNIEEQALTNYNNLYIIIENLLKKNECIKFEDLKNYYYKLKKREQRQDGLSTLPIIGKMIKNNIFQSSLTSENILKIAQMMKRCRIGYIDNKFFDFLKTNKNHFYYLYFKDDYENEIITINYQNNAYDSLFPSNLN